MAGNVFVGRRAYLTQILGGDVEAGRLGGFFVAAGIPGIGKTRLLDELARTVEKEAGTVFRVHCDHFQAIGQQYGTSPFDEAAEFRQFKMLLQEAIPEYVEEATDALNWLELRPGFGGSRHAQALAGRGETSHDPGQIIEQVTASTNRLAEDPSGLRHRLLVLVDDFHLLVGRPLGGWVMQWLAGIRGADIVITHQYPRHGQQLETPAHAVRLPLGNLDREDVQAYLVAHPGIGPDVAEITGPVWEFTNGHPHALVLVADLIMESGGPGEAVRVIQQLGVLQGGLAAQLEALVDRIFSAVDDTEVRDTLYSLCVGPHFDRTLLMRLLNVDKAHAQTLIDRIRPFSFVTESDVGHSFLAIGDFVRRIGSTYLDPSRRQEIHAVAADYYHGLLVDEIAEDESWSQLWFRYEKRDFQNLERDWLYHLSSLTGRHRRSSRLEIARIFLDGFWWWGCYVPFPFCEEILADWLSVTANDKEDRAWGEALRTLYDNYPRGGRMSDASREQWTTVRRALRYLWDRGGLDEPDENPEMRHVRGILDLFRADALRFVNPHDSRVDGLLDDAIEQFTADEDEWDVAWTEYYRADLVLLRREYERAMSLARQAALDYAELDDSELLANLHRVCADAHWDLGKYGAALDGYARAVALAYRYHVKDVPDQYTTAFQQEMVDRSMERMAELRTRDRDEGHAVLRAACARIRAFFGPYWREIGADEVADDGLDAVRAVEEGRPEEAASLLFPAGPPGLGTDMTRYGTEYEYICREVTGDMADELAQPPCTPLPPVES
jgi:tetratricopeptide (TPR) repeat protein